MEISLEGRHALVTGGGRGIGEATARLLHEAGATVSVCDRDLANAQAVAGSIGGEAHHVDVSDEHSVARLAAALADRPPVDVLVNCAGNLQNLDRPEDLPLSVWDRITAVHQRGTYLMCTTFGLQMVERRRGAIVNIASTAALRSAPLHAYGPAKAAILMQTQCLAVEWGWAGVRVNSVSPGFVPSPGVRKGFDSGMMDEAHCAKGAALGRLVEPREIAAAVLFLASDFASAITGTNLPVDAGWLAATGWESYGGVRKAPVARQSE